MGAFLRSSSQILQILTRGRQCVWDNTIGGTLFSDLQLRQSSKHLQISINVMRLRPFHRLKNTSWCIKWYQRVSSSSPISCNTVLNCSLNWKELVLGPDSFQYKLISPRRKYAVKLSLVGCQKSCRQRIRSFLRASNFYLQSNSCDSRSRQVLFNSIHVFQILILYYSQNYPFFRGH